MTSVVVCGCAGVLPLAGVALHYLQYCLGFRELGVEVMYLEESDAWPYHPDEDRPDDEAGRCGYRAADRGRTRVAGRDRGIAQDDGQRPE